MSNTSEILIVPPRPTIEVHLEDGRVLSGPRGAAVGDFLQLIQDEGIPPIVGAILNGELRELTFPVDMDARVRPVTMGEADGMRIYRRSLTFLLEAAYEELFANGALSIDHSVSSGGYFCRLTGRQPLSANEIDKLEEKMWAIVEVDLPFERQEVPLSEAVAYFESKDHQDKVRLVAHRKKNYLVLYSLGEYKDYHHGYMVPSSGFLRWFGLAATDGGFTLRFPRRHRPTELMPVPQYSTLLDTFRRYGNWLTTLGIDSVGTLNDAIVDERVQELILVSEALHEQSVTEIAAQVADRSDQARVVLISGPSSSGKTTFSRRLTVQLLARGISPFPLEMDRFFVDRINTPRDESGEFDFEHIDALDRTRLNKNLQSLIAGEPTRLPHYDFMTGVSEDVSTVSLDAGQIIILEGIHGLNPDLLPDIPEEQTFRIYVSALTQLNLDRSNRVSTTDTRLVRRIVRDARERGYSPQETIWRWESVRRGEKRYIFPFQENADLMFNSALVYELAVLKRLAEPLLRQVPYGTPERVEAKRLLALLEWFLSCDQDWIPDNSLLREFVGGSNLSGFSLWRKG